MSATHLAEFDGVPTRTTSLLTARDVADQLSVSAETVLRWTRQGTLPAFRLPGGGLRYREADLTEWLAERTTPRQRVSAPATSAARAVRYSASIPESEE